MPDREAVVHGEPQRCMGLYHICARTGECLGWCSITGNNVISQIGYPRSYLPVSGTVMGQTGCGPIHHSQQPQTSPVADERRQDESWGPRCLQRGLDQMDFHVAVCASSNQHSPDGSPPQNIRGQSLSSSPWCGRRSPDAQLYSELACDPCP